VYVVSVTADEDEGANGSTGFRDRLDRLRTELSRDAVPGEGLRDRKKRLTRQLISDTATGMFLERGFDQVRVSEVATACGVSEKTVFNYFPTKESLLFDREEAMAQQLRKALGRREPMLSPIAAAVEIIVADADEMCQEWAEDEAVSLPLVRQFAEMIEDTPALRAAQHAMTERLVQVAAEAMAERAGLDPDAPEPQIAATAIVGLMGIQFQAMRRYADEGLTIDEFRAAVLDDVQRAARLIDTGLWSFSVAVQGADTRQQLKEAAVAANDARKQVVTALKQARDAWRQALTEAQAQHHKREEWEHVHREIQQQHRAMREQQKEMREQQREMRQRQREARTQMKNNLRRPNR
jgi:AcrR family transcriptional regulator